MQAVPLLSRANAYFDRYLAADWSASSSPVRGTDSIWIAEVGWTSDGAWHEEPAVNCATRYQAEAYLAVRLAAAGRTLIGLDFAFGYPVGFSRLLPGNGEPWLRVATYLAREIRDSASNANNRNAVAAGINRRIGEGPGPFWGCHKRAASPDLTVRRVGVFQFPFAGLQEYRLTDDAVRDTGTPLLSVWKINQGVSVGGQTLVGIPYLMRLREAIRAGHRDFVIWPFETGWTPGGEGVTAVEIFPSLIGGKTPRDEIKDRHQVRQCILHFALLDAAGELMGNFSRPAGLSDADEGVVRSEEGWIFLAQRPTGSSHTSHGSTPSRETRSPSPG